MTDPRGADDASEHVQAPPGGNGFDAPDSGDTPAPAAAAGREPEGNGHPAPITAVPGTPVALRGRWIVPLAVVSAFSGMFMLLGAFIGTTLGGRAAPQTNAQVALALSGALAGGLTGVWAGAAVAIRLTGQDPGGRLVTTGVCGSVGLLAGVALLVVAFRSIGLLSGLGLMAPGIGAAVGDRIAIQRRTKAGR